MKNRTIEDLLPFYFRDKLKPEEKAEVENWKSSSEINRQIFEDSQKAWEATEQLRRMKKYNPEKAIPIVHSKIQNRTKFRAFDIFQKIAAVLIIPLLFTTIWLAKKPASREKPYVEWHTLKTPAGMRSEFFLPDSTKVYLNSKTTLTYPLAFNDSIREVKLKGEAYFEVNENKKVPFVVNSGRVDIEVTGTEFKVSNYAHEQLTEIVLVSGRLNLFRGDFFLSKTDLTPLKPGERFSFDQKHKTMNIDRVSVEKYIAWKDGILMFRDDSMEEVVRRLNRWFNVEIQLTGPELNDYVYTATFEDESLMQILELLKISAPIDYTIKQRERRTDNSFSKMKIVIEQK